jgi:hypothetical protein
VAPGPDVQELLKDLDGRGGRDLSAAVRLQQPSL